MSEIFPSEIMEEIIKKNEKCKYDDFVSYLSFFMTCKTFYSLEKKTTEVIDSGYATSEEQLRYCYSGNNFKPDNKSPKLVHCYSVEYSRPELSMMAFIEYNVNFGDVHEEYFDLLSIQMILSSYVL